MASRDTVLLLNVTRDVHDVKGQKKYKSKQMIYGADTHCVWFVVEERQAVGGHQEHRDDGASTAALMRVAWQHSRRALRCLLHYKRPLVTSSQVT
jgi:hypothetical protein